MNLNLGTTLMKQNSIYVWLLSFGTESFVVQFASQKYKDYDIKNYKFACCFVWVWNLVIKNEDGM